LHNYGQTVNGDPSTHPDADIDAPLAWDLWTGECNPNFRIAVIDTGVEYTHSDLAANMWTNPGESGGGRETNNIDDDNNGCIDDVHGCNFTIVPPRGTVQDEIGHGTHVAGTIAAVGNNGVGVVGVNWRAKIVALKVCTPSGCLSAAIVDALEYCTDNDIKVSNTSIYCISPCCTEQQWAPVKAAIQESQSIGHIFVTIAGNYNQIDVPCNDRSRDNDINPVYPANLDLSPYPDSIIVVAATNNDDLLYADSHYGATTVDIGAPGVNVYSTNFNNAYSFKTGTSMAAPHVTGVVGLVWSRFPDWRWQQVRDRVLNTFREIPALDGKTVKEGMVNAYRALFVDCNSNEIDDACDISCGSPGGPCYNIPDCGGRSDVKTSETDCCVAHDTPDCSDQTIQNCVCTYLCTPGCEESFPYSYCCAEPEEGGIWDANCAAFAATECVSPICNYAPDGLPDECALPTMPGRIVWDSDPLSTD